MKILPAIDLLDGRAVRLHKGDYAQVTVFDTDPTAVAKRFRAHTDRLHVVDLEGARRGSPVQRALIEDIIRTFDGIVQVGGGVRSKEAFEAYLALGAKRVVLGTAAVKDPSLVRALANAHPGTVVIAVDAKNGFIATDGWTKESSIRAVDLVKDLADAPIAAVLYTDVARDGTGTGPNLEATKALADASPFPIIASGGVGKLADIEVLSKLANVESVVVGRALYDRVFTLEEAVRASGDETR